VVGGGGEKGGLAQVVAQVDPVPSGDEELVPGQVKKADAREARLVAGAFEDTRLVACGDEREGLPGGARVEQVEVCFEIVEVEIASVKDRVVIQATGGQRGAQRPGGALEHDQAGGKMERRLGGDVVLSRQFADGGFVEHGCVLGRAAPVGRALEFNRFSGRGDAGKVKAFFALPGWI